MLKVPAADVRSVALRLIRDRGHYDELVMKAMAGARVSLWIATANIKDLQIEAPIGSRARAAGRYQSIVELFALLSERGVDIRILHGGLPSRAFREQLQKRKTLARLQMQRCPRVHLKMVAVDGALLYLGSANLTGAGLGAKGEGRRNFEAGIVTEDDVLLDEMQAAFDTIWRGQPCGSCKIRNLCPAPLDVSVALPTAKLVKLAAPGPCRNGPGRSVRTIPAARERQRAGRASGRGRRP